MLVPRSSRKPLDDPPLGRDPIFDTFHELVSATHGRAAAYRAFIEADRDASTALDLLTAQEEAKAAKEQAKKSQVAVQMPGQG